MKNIIILLLSILVISCTPKVEELITAINNEDTEKVKKLVDRGAELYRPDIDKQPLYFVTKKRNLEMLKSLLEGGLVKYINRYDLQYMTDHLWVEGITLLFDYGFDVKSMIETDWSLFDWAIKYKHNDLLKKMISLGADINSDYDGNGTNSFFTALKYSNNEMIEYLVEKANVDLTVKTKKGDSILTYLIGKRDINKIKYLIDSGIDLKARGINNLNPWEIIADQWSEKSLEIANIFWAQGLTFDFENNLALHYASEYHVYEYVEWLLKHGVDPNKKDNEGFTADIYADTLVKYYNPEDEAIGITYEDVRNKARSISKLIRSYQ